MPMLVPLQIKMLDISVAATREPEAAAISIGTRATRRVGMFCSTERRSL